MLMQRNSSNGCTWWQDLSWLLLGLAKKKKGGGASSMFGLTEKGVESKPESIALAWCRVLVCPHIKCSFQC